MNPTAAITQAAHETLERHRESLNGYCMACPWSDPLPPFPCPDRVVAERVVQLAADVAATHEKIRELVIELRGPVRVDRGAYQITEAILGLLEPAEHTHEETT